MSKRSKARGRRATKRNLFGAENVYSTTGDLLKFHEALQRGKILKKSTLAEMYSSQKLITGENYNSFVLTNYPSKDGLGWFVADDESNGKIVCHPGGDIGYTSYFLRNALDRQKCFQHHFDWQTVYRRRRDACGRARAFDS